MSHTAIAKAQQIVAADEWRGDHRVNLTTVVGAGRVLSHRVSELERVIVKARREFRNGGDPLSARAWLCRVDVDEDQYPKD